MKAPDYAMNDIVRMRKKHPCGGDRWQITRLGADIKLKCLKCGRMVMLGRSDFERNLAQVIEPGRQEQ